MSSTCNRGLGHIGSWVCHELAQKGQKGHCHWSLRRRLSYLEGMEDHIKFVPADVFDQASLYRLFVEQKGAIEARGPYRRSDGGPLFATNPRHHIYTNTMGTVDMLEASRIFGFAVCLYQLRRRVRVRDKIRVRMNR